MTTLAPTEAVKQAVVRGCASRAEIAAETGLAAGVVELVMDHLERSGELRRETLSSCPSGGCGSCDSSGACSGSGRSVASRGPVLLKLTARPKEG